MSKITLVSSTNLVVSKKSTAQMKVVADQPGEFNAYIGHPQINPEAWAETSTSSADEDSLDYDFDDYHELPIPDVHAEDWWLH